MALLLRVGGAPLRRRRQLALRSVTGASDDEAPPLSTGGRRLELGDADASSTASSANGESLEARAAEAERERLGRRRLGLQLQLRLIALVGVVVVTFGRLGLGVATLGDVDASAGPASMVSGISAWR